MSDLISRQAAIDEAKEWIDAVYFEENDKRERKAIECFIGSLKNMPSAQPEQRWIPVSDRLPERGVSVLISHVGYVFEDYLDVDDGALFFWNTGFDLDEERQNIAWMPLPEPWRGEEE